MTEKKVTKNSLNFDDDHLMDVLKKNTVILEEIKKLSEETRKKIEKKHKK